MVGLIILDGWGYSKDKQGNAILMAKKPNFDYLWQNYPHTLLEACGKEVGLPWGEVGNSEVGHLSIGSGRVVYQSFQMISRAIFSGEFFHNSKLIDLIKQTKKNNSSIHLIGLISSGGVHSHIDHLEAVLKMLHQEKFSGPVFIHFITDGRDTNPKTAELYLDKLKKLITKTELAAKIATVSGRYYSMDRDRRWQRTELAYKAIAEGEGTTANSADEAIKKAYTDGATDEFIKPTVILENGKATGIVNPGDTVFFFNFRPERMRQLVETFIFKKDQMIGVEPKKNLLITTLTEYDKSLPVIALYEEPEIKNSLAEIISQNKLSQIHLAETEKYAHVTYFFNGWHPIPFKNEKWAVVPSPDVPTYDKKPQMSAGSVVNRLVLELKKQKYDFVLINFANADMVGHTGNLKATIKAVEAIDKELGRLAKIFASGHLLITADHGNAEKMLEKNGQINTEHEMSPVPFMIIGKELKKNPPKDKTEPKNIGILADVAPTILDIMKLPQPPEMTGYSLLKTMSK